MSQTISVSTTMDEQGFHDFAVFDVFHHHRSWMRPAIFAVIMLVFSGICLSQLGKRPGAGLLSAVLAIVAIGLPATYFGMYFYSLSQQTKKMHLPRPFYRTELSEEGASIWMVGSQDKAEPTEQHSWESIYCAYRMPASVYLYVEQGKAFLLNDRTEAVWKVLQEKLPAEKLHDMRK